MEYTLTNGARLLVREAEKADAAAIIDYMNQVGGESDNLSFGAGECGHTVESEEAFIENAARQANSVMLLGIVGGEIVAVGNLMGRARARLSHNAGISIAVRKAYWRLGIGEIVMRSLIAYARGEGVRIVHLEVRTDNHGAIRLYEKLGFLPVGVFREEIFVGGTYVDTLAMDLFL